MSTGWDDNFAANSWINGNIFPNRWGDSGEFYAGNGGLVMYDDGNAAGFTRPDNGAGASDGYGTYSVTLQANSLATGAYICLWPSTNNWPGPEIDLYETLNNKPYVTVHWAGANGSNQYQSYFLPSSFNPWARNTISLNWQSDSLTFSVNGQQVVRYTAGGSVPIPADYAHGGQNEAFGVGLQGGDKGASVTLYDMSYSPTGSAAPVAAAAPSSPSGAIGISAPGTVTGATPYSESITFSNPSLANHTIYAVTMNNANQFEEGWIPITLNSSGVGTHTMTFQHSGDYMIAVSDTSSEANKGVSSRITINAPSSGASAPTSSAPAAAASPWITISDPGTVSGVPHTGTINFSDPGLSGAYALVMNPGNVAEENWTWVPFDGNGHGSLAMTFRETGDYVLAVANTSTMADKSWSSRIAIG